MNIHGFLLPMVNILPMWGWGEERDAARLEYDDEAWSGVDLTTFRPLLQFKTRPKTFMNLLEKCVRKRILLRKLIIGNVGWK